MTVDLRDVVERHAERLRPHIPGMTITSDDCRHCIISGSGLQIDVYQDHRDQSISSSLTWTFDGEVQEPIDTQTAFRMTSDGEDRPRPADFESRVVSEMDQLTRVLDHGREQGISPRDWLFYFYGYNAAYTDCLNRRFEYKGS